MADSARPYRKRKRDDNEAAQDRSRSLQQKRYSYQRFSHNDKAVFAETHYTKQAAATLQITQSSGSFSSHHDPYSVSMRYSNQARMLAPSLCNQNQAVHPAARTSTTGSVQCLPAVSNPRDISNQFRPATRLDYTQAQSVNHLDESESRDNTSLSHALVPRDSFSTTNTHYLNNPGHSSAHKALCRSDEEAPAAKKGIKATPQRKRKSTTVLECRINSLAIGAAMRNEKRLKPKLPVVPCQSGWVIPRQKRGGHRTKIRRSATTLSLQHDSDINSQKDSKLVQQMRQQMAPHKAEHMDHHMGVSVYLQVVQEFYLIYSLSLRKHLTAFQALSLFSIPQDISWALYVLHADFCLGSQERYLREFFIDYTRLMETFRTFDTLFRTLPVFGRKSPTFQRYLGQLDSLALLLRKWPRCLSTFQKCGFFPFRTFVLEREGDPQLEILDPLEYCRTKKELEYCRTKKELHSVIMQEAFITQYLKSKSPHHRLSDVSLFVETTKPTGTTRWNEMSIKNIRIWSSPEVNKVNLEFRRDKISCKVRIRRFIPRVSDTLSHTWWDGKHVRKHSVPPYAIADMHEAGLEVKRYIDLNISSGVNCFLNNEDVFLRDTYDTALQYALETKTKGSELLLDTLRLWISMSLIRQPKGIIGDTKFGSTVRHRSSPCHGMVLPSPVLEAQLEIIITTMISIPLKKRILDTFEDMFRKSDRGDWFAIYLTYFILLYNGSASLRQRDDLPNMFRSKNTKAQSASLHSGLTTMIELFHRRLKGAIPFGLASNPSRAHTLIEAGMKPDQIAFVQKTASWVAQRKHELSTLSQVDHLAHDFHFISQLYDEDWTPRRFL